MNNEINNVWKKVAGLFAFVTLRADERPEEEYDGR